MLIKIHEKFYSILDAEFKADFKNIIFYVFWTFFDSEINFSSNVAQNS